MISINKFPVFFIKHFNLNTIKMNLENGKYKDKYLNEVEKIEIKDDRLFEDISFTPFKSDVFFITQRNNKKCILISCNQGLFQKIMTDNSEIVEYPCTWCIKNINNFIQCPIKQRIIDNKIEYEGMGTFCSNECVKSFIVNFKESFEFKEILVNSEQLFINKLYSENIDYNSLNVRPHFYLRKIANGPIKDNAYYSNSISIKSTNEYIKLPLSIIYKIRKNA